MEFGIVVCQPLHDDRIRPQFGGFAEDVGIDEVGHGGLLKIKIAGRGGVAFDLPVVDRAIAQNVHEFLSGLEMGIHLELRISG